MTDDDRLLAVDDENAIVYEIDYLQGGLVKAFALGEPTLRGDFEGLAVAGRAVYLMTSDAEIYVAEEGEDGARVDYERFRTGLDDECEFEGLAHDAARSRLLLLCKDVRNKSTIDTLAIFPWDLERQAADEDSAIRLPIREISLALRVRSLHPSGIVIDRGSGHMLIVAAREQALIELTGDGGFVDARRLPLAGRHPQAEGIELTAGGRIVLADEGGKGRARLSVYDPDRRQ